MIKTIIFDSGGVIVDSSALLNLFVAVFQPKNVDKFWKEIAKSVGMSDNKKIPKDLWTKHYERLAKIDKDVLVIVSKLKKNYKTALISNTIEPHAKINKRLGLFDNFDVVVLSYEVQMTKDEQSIFLFTVKKLGVKPEECVFIDDIQKFVDTAKSFGMKGILFKNAEQLKKELADLGVKID